MPIVLADRVKETTTTFGTTSPIVLSGAVTGFQPFSVILNGNSTYYCMSGQGTSEWEVGIGTWSTGNTLTRCTILSNSAGNTSPLSFSTGTKDVILTYPSERAVLTDFAQTLTNKRITPRISAAVSTVTPNADTDDQFNATGLGSTATIVNPTYTITPADGQRLTLRLTSTAGTTLTWGSAYTGRGIALPNNLTNFTYVGCIYNLAASSWDVIALTGPG